MLLQDEYIKTIDSVIAFLQGKIQHWRSNLSGRLLPEASRFAQLKSIGLWDYGDTRKAETLATCTSKISLILSWNVWMITLVSAVCGTFGRSANSFDNCMKRYNKKQPILMMFFFRF
jgi:hypothetical protein